MIHLSVVGLLIGLSDLISLEHRYRDFLYFGYFQGKKSINTYRDWTLLKRCCPRNRRHGDVSSYIGQYLLTQYYIYVCHRTEQKYFYFLFILYQYYSRICEWACVRELFDVICLTFKVYTTFWINRAEIITITVGRNYICTLYTLSNIRNSHAF